jgi:Zn-dependent protease
VSPSTQQFESLAQQAKLAGQAGDWRASRAYWQQALALLPHESPDHRTVQTRIENIDAQLAAASVQDHSKAGGAAKWAAKLGPVGVVLWKFKTILLIAVTKGKFLLLGLTKLSTLTTMLASFGLYWTLYGWRFAGGLVLSIYIHEMGHVAALRKYGIAATAPMFIPGFGAVVMLKQHLTSVAEDARVGLAGPIWGLGAAVVAWAAAVSTGQPIWYAIARTGAWINLFNLIPVWQLDGGRGFRALTRKQRGIALVAALFMWAITEETMLLFVAMGATYRMFSRDYAEEPDNGALTQYVGLVVLLALLVLMSGNPLRGL